MTHTLVGIGSPALFHSNFLSCVDQVFLPFTPSFSLSLRDVLPFTLKLPEAIASARTSADLEEVVKLGAGLYSYLIIYLGKSIQLGETVTEGEI